MSDFNFFRSLFLEIRDDNLHLTAQELFDLVYARFLTELISAFREISNSEIDSISSGFEDLNDSVNLDPDHKEATKANRLPIYFNTIFKHFTEKRDVRRKQEHKDQIEAERLQRHEILQDQIRLNN